MKAQNELVLKIDKIKRLNNWICPQSPKRSRGGNHRGTPASGENDANSSRLR